MSNISRHDANLLGILESFLEEVQFQFIDTEEYDKYRFYLTESFDEAFKIINILKDKQL